jgi:hypothetical protein
MIRAKQPYSRPAVNLTNEELHRWYSMRFPKGIGIFQPLLDRLHMKAIPQHMADAPAVNECPHCNTPLDEN